MSSDIPPGAHGSSHTQQGEFAGGLTIWNACVLSLAAWVAAGQMGVACNIHKGASCQPASCTYSSSLGQLITLSITLPFSVMLHGTMLTRQRHQKSLGTQARS